MQCDPNDTAAGGEYTKGMRPKRIRYPNGRYVHYAYPTALDEALGRVAAIRDDSGGSPGTTVASYQHDGAGRIVVEDYEQAKVRLDLWGQTSGIYADFDRFDNCEQSPISAREIADSPQFTGFPAIIPTMDRPATVDMLMALSAKGA